MTPEELAAAAKRGAVSMASDPTLRHYSPETMGLVYERTVINLAGAGDLLKAASKIAVDPALADVPVMVLDDLVAASFRHFALGIGER